MDDLTAQFQKGLALRSQGRLQEAVAVFDETCKRYPQAANARAFLGLTLCNVGHFDRGLAELRQAVAIEPRNPDWHCNLGVALFAAGNVADAEAELRRSLVLAPAHADAFNNLSLVLKARGDFEASARAARRAIALRPELVQAQLNLATALLPLGRFAEAWGPYCARPHPRVNLRDPHLTSAADHHDRLPERPAAIVLHGEQGLGDTLFFLRFAPALRALGHRLAFWGDLRLRGILSGTGLFEHFMAPEAAPAAGLAVLWAGDLPRLLNAADPSAFPGPLRLVPDPVLRAEAIERLSALGPAPFIGVTWRAGLPREGQVVLSKVVHPALLGRALAEVEGTFLCMQRDPFPDETSRFAHAAGRPLHDASDVNTSLDHALAMLDALDEYVSVSNTNIHIRAATNRRAHVLVPWPPEWRWLDRGPTSPWFPSMTIYRESPTGDWSSLTTLSEHFRKTAQ